MIDFIAALVVMGAIIHFDQEEPRQTPKTKYPMDETVIDPNHYEDKN